MSTHAVADNNDDSYKSSYGVVKKDAEEQRVHANREKIDSILKKSIYQHAAAEEPLNKFHTWFDSKPGKQALNLNRNIRVNQTYFGITWDVVGGSALAVFTHGTEGRVPNKQPCIRGQKSIGAFDLSVHDNSLVAVGSNEGEIKLWRIPEGGLKKHLDNGDELSTVEAAGKVLFMSFHPYIANVLVTVSQSYEGCSIELWDVTDPAKPESKLSVPVAEEGLSDLAFGPNGQYIAVTTKDGKASIIDPRTGKVEHTWSPPENGRDVHIMWVTRTRLVTAGYGRGNRRTMSLFDTSNLDKPLATQELPHANNAISVHYDEHSRIVYVTNIGGSYVHLYQVHAAEPHFEALDTYKAKSDFSSQAFFPRSVCDIKKVEVARSIKIDAKKSISKYPWVVPRKRLEFFQDDLYPDARSDEPLMSAADFFANKNASGVEPKLVSLQPAGMEKLSNAPEEELSVQKKRYLAHKAKVEAPKAKGVLGHESSEEVHDHFRTIAKTMPSKNRWDAVVDDKDEVDDDEWGSDSD